MYKHFILERRKGFIKDKAPEPNVKYRLEFGLTRMELIEFSADGSMAKVTVIKL